MARGSLRAHVGHPLLMKPLASGWLCSKFPAVTLLRVGRGACGETVTLPHCCPSGDSHAILARGPPGAFRVLLLLT